MADEKQYSGLTIAPQNPNAYGNTQSASNYIPTSTQTPQATTPSLSQSEFDNIIAQAKADWQSANLAGNQAAMDAAHQRAEQARAQYGYSGGSDGVTFSGSTQSALDAYLRERKNAWQTYHDAGDQAGMDREHQLAERARAQFGYSGGSDGSQYIPLGATTNREYTSVNQLPDGWTSGYINGVNYTRDSGGRIYDGNNQYVGTGYNDDTGEWTYSNQEDAAKAALQSMKIHNGLTGMSDEEAAAYIANNLGGVPYDLLQATMAGTTGDYWKTHYAAQQQQQQQMASEYNTLVNYLQNAQNAYNNPFLGYDVTANNSQYITPNSTRMFSNNFGDLLNQNVSAGNGYYSNWADGLNANATTNAKLPDSFYNNYLKMLLNQGKI